MKNIIFPKGWITIFIGLFISFHAFSQTDAVKTITLSVKGNCEQCKKRIENAADIKGVKVSNWDQKTQVLTVTFNSAKVTPEQIETAIAKSGHDAGNVKSTDAAYKKLPGCCQYKDHVCTEKK